MQSGHNVGDLVRASVVEQHAAEAVVRDAEHLPTRGVHIAVAEQLAGTQPSAIHDDGAGFKRFVELGHHSLLDLPASLLTCAAQIVEIHAHVDHRRAERQAVEVASRQLLWLGVAEVHDARRPLRIGAVRRAQLQHLA
jgi:hypothetical protein